MSGRTADDTTVPFGQSTGKSYQESPNTLVKLIARIHCSENTRLNATGSEKAQVLEAACVTNERKESKAKHRL